MHRFSNSNPAVRATFATLSAVCILGSASHASAQESPTRVEVTVVEHPRGTDEGQIVVVPDDSGVGYAAPPAAPPHGARLRRDPYYEGMEMPPGGQIIERRRKGLWISGIPMFGVPYLFTALGASIASDLGSDSANVFYVPVFGPIIGAATSGTDSSAARAFFVFDGLLQGAGVTMFALGMRKRPYVQYYANADTDEPGIFVSPQISLRGAGLTVSGRF